MNHQYVLLYLIVVDCLCAMNIWGGWAERHYTKHKDAKWKWFWFDFFRVPKTERNCVRLIKGSCIASMICATLGGGYVILFVPAGQ